MFLVVVLILKFIVKLRSPTDVSIRYKLLMNFNRIYGLCDSAKDKLNLGRLVRNQERTQNWTFILLPFSHGKFLNPLVSYLKYYGLGGGMVAWPHFGSTSVRDSKLLTP